MILNEGLYREFKKDGDEAVKRFNELRDKHDGSTPDAFMEFGRNNPEKRDEYLKYLSRVNIGDAVNWELYFHFKKWRDVFFKCDDYGDPDELQALVNRLSDALCLPRIKRIVGVSQ